MTEEKMSLQQELEMQNGSCAQNESDVLQFIDDAASELTADEVEYRMMTERCRISLDKHYKPKEFLLRISGIPTLSLGDIHLIQAQAKQGKSTLVTILVAACISGKFGPVEYALGRDIRIAVFDTEQFECDTHRQYRNMVEIGGDEGDNHIELQVYNLRPLGYGERNRLVREVIQREKPQFVVIDGIRDLTPDINDPIACPVLVQEIMQLASEVECAILGVLHNNPGEGKARGWLGTEWINKCGYSYEVEKSGSVVTVKTPINRGAPVPEWQFTFGEGGKPTCDRKFIEHRLKVDAEKKTAEAERKKAELAEKKKVVAEMRKAEMVMQRIHKDNEYIKPIKDILNAHGGSMTKTQLAIAMKEKTGLGQSASLDAINRLLKRENAPLIMRDNMIGIRYEHEEGKIF